MALKPYDGEFTPITPPEPPKLKPYTGAFTPISPPTQAAPAPESSGLARRVLGDTAVDVGKGIVGAGEAVVGLADLATGGHAGKALESIGYDPARTRESLGELYSPERKAANEAVGQAEGFIDTTLTALQNPSTIVGTTVESLPSMLGGGAVARGIGAIGKLAPIARAAIGEGAVSAGQSAEQLRQQNDDGLLDGRDTVAAVGSGAGTGLLALAGGSVAKRLGIADVDTALAGAATQEARSGIIRRALQGIVSEGVLEELPQSAQEQMWQNYATDRPLMENVGAAAAQGMLAGALTGAPFAALAGSAPGPIAPPQGNGDVARDNSIDVSPLETPAAPIQTPFPNAAPGSLASAGNAVAAATQPASGSLAGAAVTPPAAEPVVQPAQTESSPNPVPPSNMDPATGELLPPDPKPIIDFLIAQARANGRMPGVTSLVNANPGLTKEDARNLRSQANAALKAASLPQRAEPTDGQARGDANAATGALPDGRDDGQADAGQDQAGPEVPGTESVDQATQAGGPEPAGEPEVAGDPSGAQPEGLNLSLQGENADATKGSGENLSYDESDEAQDGDIMPPSGSPFTIRDAAEKEAARHEGGRVFEVDGGFVVRVPQVASADQTATAATAPATPAQDGQAAPATQQGQPAPSQEGPSLAAPVEGGQPSVTPSEGVQPAPRASEGTLQGHDAAALPAASGSKQPTAKEAPRPQPPQTAGLPEASGDARSGGSRPSPESAPASGAVQAAVGDKVTIHRGLYAGNSGTVEAVRQDGQVVVRGDGARKSGFLVSTEDLVPPAATPEQPEPAKAKQPNGSDSAKAAALFKRGGDLNDLIEAYRATGRVVHHYPRKKQVSLDGRTMPVAEAIAKMRSVLALRETITPAEDKHLGNNIDGLPLYERKDGSRYIIRNGRPDFGGALLTEAEAQADRAQAGEVQSAANEAATSPKNDLPAPTEAQKEAGNFKVGRIKVNGLDISIEHPAGVKRKEEHSQPLAHAYGYIRRTEGNDGEHVDVFLGDNATDTSLPVFVVNQHTKDGKFDEHKALFGFKSVPEARKAYLSNYPKGFKGLGSIRRMTQDEFKAWVSDPKNTKKAAKATGKEPLQVAEAAVRADYQQAMAAKTGQADHDWANNAFADDIVKALNRDPAAIEWARKTLANGLNTTGLRVFAKHAGIKLPRSQKDQRAAIDAWAGISAEQRAESDAKLSKAKAQRKAAEVADKRAKQPIPDFKDYAEALRFADRRAEAFDSKGQYRATAEYREWVDKARPLYEKALAEQQTRAKTKTDAAGVQPGDKVRTSQIGAFLTSESWTGTVFLKNGMPWVRIDNGGTIPVSKNGKVTQARSVRWDDRWKKVEPIPALPAQTDADRAELERRAAEQAPKIAALTTEQARAGLAAIGETKARDLRDPKDALSRQHPDDVDTALAAAASRDAVSEPFNSEKFNADRKATIKASREAGNRHLDDESFPSVETMRGKAIYSVHDPKVRGVIRTVDNRGNVYVNWSDAYSAEKEMAPEVKDGTKTVRQSSLGPTDLKDYVFADAAKKPAPKEAGEGKAPDKIEDFGEKIHGARKDYAADYAQRLDDAREFEIAAHPLSKTWPEPNYQQMLDDGADPWAVAFIRVMRDAVPTKPSKSWKLKGWVEKVATLRDMATKMLGDAESQHQVRMLYESAAFAPLRDKMEGQRELYQQFGHAVSLKGVTFQKQHYTLFRGERNVTKWSIERAAKATAFSNWPHQFVVADTKEDALKQFKAVHAKMVADGQNASGTRSKGPVKFDIYSRRSQKGKWFIGKKIGKDYLDLAEFDSPKDARAYLQSHQAELERKLAVERAIPSHRKAGNDPRVGADHRKGADVAPEQFAETFGFRGVQFGNYVEGPRRQADLNRAYDALMDMAGVLGLPPRALSLNGELGLAFGARGKGGKNAAAAHYESGHVVINLTKGSGPGSLAHEWFHALDNYFSRKGGKKQGYLTDPKRGPGTDGVRPEMVQAFKEVMAAIHATRLAERSRELDKRRTKPYWSTDLEMAARSFESYMLTKLADQGAANDYLVNVLGEKTWEALAGPGLYPYIVTEEVPAIRAAFDHFFQTVQTRETENGNVALESTDTFYSALAQSIETAKGAPKRGTYGVWKGWLDGAQRRGEFKQGERDWLGLDDWLKGRETTTREELADFVRANQVKVQDVVLGAPGSVEDAMGRIEAAGYYVDFDDRAERVILTRDGETVPVPDSLRQDFNLILNTEFDGTDAGVRAGGAKFASYQLPGGENYRELLLTLPSMDGGVDRIAALSRDELGRIYEQEIGYDPTEDDPSITTDALREMVRGLPAAAAEAGTTAPSVPTNNFHSSHFDQPNILAHVRFNERTDADGKKVLFLEEIQSDWHQAGRKKGYKGHIEGRAITEAEFEEFVALGRDPNPTPEGDARYEELRQLNEGLPSNGVPDAPFKSTDEWAMLAFKRMVREAAQRGFDKIAWTTGAQQAERYDLSKQVQRIRWDTSDDSTDSDERYDLRIELKEGEPIYRTGLDANGISELVGKEIADRITKAGTSYGFIQGDGLKVGGEGMRAFYDKILPAAVNKWAKRLGGKVGHVDIKATDMPWSEYEKYAVDHPYRVKNAPRVHSLTLTPEMREAALAGMPLFNTDQELTEDDLSPEHRESFERFRNANLAREKAAALSRAQGEADALRYHLRDAVDALLGKSGVRVQFIRDFNGLPEDVKRDVESRNADPGRAGIRTAGLYDPSIAGQTAYLFTNVVQSPKQAMWHAAHEIAGHDGLRKLLGPQLDKALRLAGENPTVKAVADAIFAERNLAGEVSKGNLSQERAELLAIEEALAELAASVRTGDYARIQSRYGVEVPQGIRAKVKAAINEFLRRLKNLLNKQAGRNAFTDEDVRALLEAAWQAASGANETQGGVAESTDRSAIQQQAKSLGLPATGTTASIANLVRIAQANPRTWTRDDFDAILPHLAIHQDFRDSSPEKVASIMRDGLNKGMVDSLQAVAGQGGRSFGKGLVGGDAYVFVKGALKYKGANDPHLAPGNVPLFHFRPEKGQDVFEAITTTASAAPPLAPLADVTRRFQDETGDSPEQALTRLSGIAVRNNMREAGNLGGAMESSPYTPAQQELLDAYKEMRHPSSKYLFHTTTPDRLASIAANGLQPNSAQRFQGVSNGRLSFSANEAAAAYYGGQDDVMLRVRKNYDPGDLEPDILAGEGTYTSGKAIPASALEAKVGGKWVPLTAAVGATAADPNRDLILDASANARPAPIADPQSGETWFHGRMDDGNERAFLPGRPAFFARDRASADWFAQGEGGVTSHAIEARNTAHWRDFERTLREMGYETSEGGPGERLSADIAEHSPYDGTNTIDAIYIPAVQRALEAKGFDSLIVHDTIENTSTEALVVWKPEQIKSATANNGNFDPASPSILESVEPANTRRAQEAPADVVADVEAVMQAGHDKSILTRARERIAEFIKNPAKAIASLKDETRFAWLAGLTTDMLAVLGSDYNPSMAHYDHYLKAMNADRNDLQQQGENLSEEVRQWGAKHPAEAKALFKLMHQATIDGVDPAKEYEALQFRFSGKLHEVNAKNIKEAIKAINMMMRERSGDPKKDMIDEKNRLKAMLAAEPKRRAMYPTLKRKWDALSPEAQGHYVAMRDMYAERSRMVEDGLVQRIEDLKGDNMGASRKRVLINVIRQQFELQRLQGVYFPLQRFGQYFVAAEKAGEDTFLMFETLAGLEAGVASLRKRGFTITAQGLKSQGKAADAPSGTFVAEVIDKLKGAHVSESTQDEIYQLYLQALPEMSMRKHSIHRKAIPGFDPDAVRGFAFNMLHGAHQIARLRYAHKLADTITLLRQHADADRRKPDADTRKVAAFDGILNELDKRHQWIMNPTDSKATGLVSSFGFTYYLGLTPAAAMVNMTQTALLTFPYLASRHGPIRAMNHLLSGLRDTVRTGGHIQKVLRNDDERAMHAELQRRGTLDKTQAYNLAGIAEGGLSGHNPQWAKAMAIVGLPFHKAEVFNREASAIAAYRLAREDGKSHEEAIDLASRAVNDTHFDYTNQNRARIMQSGTAKTLLMFRQYSLNMTWHMGRMLWQATKNEDPEVKKIARRNMAGVLGMSALFSGTLGLPMMSVTFGILNAIAASAGDDDEPWDAETEFRAFLNDMLGQGAGEIAATGALNALTGADIASRVSMSQLWFRDADRELDGRGAYYHILEQIAGPMGGVLKNALVGKQMIDEGHVMRGVETMLPKAIKDTLRAQRYAAEGVNNLRGDPLVADLPLRDTLLQLTGFTPAQVARQYDVNRSLKNYEQHILDRRSRLLDSFAMAVRTDDDEARQETIAAIQRFNTKYPEIPITTRGIRQSLAARARYSERAEGGIVLNRRLAARVQQEVGR